ncbi:MAG: hypothetical protein HGA45_01880 [Chloroflexales bacterium]|nr:hypothetical protein [Chloroflexales bacterium]
MSIRPFCLTERDLDILASLAQVRYLTIQHLQWLHWHARWRPHERAAREAGLVNRRPKKAYERVAAMAERGLLRSLQRTTDRAALSFRRLPNCMGLSQAGADLLACQRGLPFEELWFDERTTRSAQTLEHSLGIGAFYAALRAELAYRGRELHGWAGDHVLCTDYDSVTVASVGHPLPIIPDGTFTLNGERYFVEIDRGTTRIEQWRKKALAYDAYGRDPRLAARYQVARFTILVVVPTEARLLTVARVIAAVHSGATDRYRFLTEERVHPFSIRRRWQRLDRVTLAPPGRAGEQALPTVTFSEDVLWTPQPGEQSV